ncbi:MAG: hypothetical protein A3F16_01970 [Deltaproteobacteria bacterium RIFCSPHIGHO2_12_FULL_43_9]|nr:MAG: hypothetical protein A3F16_01970 [Deltaproteobacteria bacterium RIFCSPHIGHO2_12_FULL_43_9]
MKYRGDIPFLIDQLTICLSSGIEFREAIEIVTSEIQESRLKNELLITTQEIQQGRPREEAFNALASKVKLKEIKQIADLIELSAETGSPLIPGLKALASSLRMELLEEAERGALKAPFILMIPLLLFILPATGLILITPFFKSLMEVLG